MSDPTEAARRQLVTEMPAELRRVVEAGEPTWDTAEMQAEFTVEGFLAPFVVVRRKADGVRGTLTFTHSPRYYFGFEAETGHTS